MKIKSLIIPALSILMGSIAYPAFSQQQYACYYNRAGAHMSIWTDSRWNPGGHVGMKKKGTQGNNKASGDPNGSGFYQCVGTRFGNSSYFPTNTSVRVPVGTSINLCKYWDSGVSFVNTVNEAKVTGAAGTTYIVYTPAGGSTFLIQKVCTDSYNFSVCMKGNAPYDDFRLEGQVVNGVQTKCSVTSIP